jgi:sarcosine oxidase
VRTFDAAVLGLGALGSAVAFQLARRGARVLGLDRFAPPHAMGSSHGQTRITRQAIGEGEHLTPFAQRSHDLWHDIEQEAGTHVLSACGLLVISSADKTSFTHVEQFFANTVAAARKHGIAHELLDAAAICRRFPQFRIADGESGYYEPDAGFLRPEAAVAAQLDLARRHGAELHADERAISFAPRREDVLITTVKNTYVAKQLVIAAGAWLPALLDDRLARHFRVFRQQQFWFAPTDTSFEPRRFPAFIWELSGRKQGLYGFPDFDGSGVKVATEQFEVTTTASSAAREVDRAECASMYELYVRPFLPQLSAQCTRASACLYTVTADFGFVIDRHPGCDRVLIASCCSGHGFKHSPALGEAIAELVLDGRSRMDLARFSLARLCAA